MRRRTSVYEVVPVSNLSDVELEAKRIASGDTSIPSTLNMVRIIARAQRVVRRRKWWARRRAS